jgi:gentisate 1,2-dioxygenase
MTTRTLVAAYQMILPGEKAPSHRHTAHALRVIIDAHGAYSTVDGEKTPMETDRFSALCSYLHERS